MANIKLRQPELIRQEKANSCWFACLKMMLLWHEGSRSVGNKQVSDLASWTTPRSFEEIDPGFLDTHGIEFVNANFDTEDELAAELQNRGPFVGGGTVGKLGAGKRRFGHAILIWGIFDGHILHNDPMLGASKIKFTSYRDKQDGERLRYKQDLARVEIRGMGN